MRIQNLFLMLVTASYLALVGCAKPLTGDTYSRDEARRTQTVSEGVISSIRVVTVEGTDSNVGKIGGAAVGAAIGSRIDGGHGVWSVLGGVIGGLGGSVAGTKTEEAVTRTEALEITIKEDNGRFRAIVQEAGNDNFNVGDRVKIVTNNKGAARVSH